jgi:Flp pilus assembly protein protease CpaA
LYIFGTGEVRLFWLFSFALISVLSVSALKVGGGDIKLIGALIAFAQVDISLMNYLWGSLSCIVILVLLHRVSTNKWSGNIAIAPAICVPFLITLL